MKGELKTAEFTKLNAFQRVPVLVLDDGTAIAETMAICRYFEATKPAPALFGTGPLRSATVEMWNRRMELNLLFPVSQTFRHLHPAMAHLEVPQVAAWGEATSPGRWRFCRSSTRSWPASAFIAGDDYSVADITALVAIDFMKPARIPRPEGLKNLDRWYAEVSSRPSAKA